MAKLFSKSVILHTRISKEDHEKLITRYTDGKIATVVRALIQMHLNGRIGRLEFTQTEKL